MHYMYIHIPLPTTIRFIRYQKKPLIKSSTTLSLLSSIQPEENIALYRNESTISSIINTTEKNNIIIENKIFISLSIFILLTILCTSLSYCIFVYIKHCLNIKKDINRISYTNSEDSNDTQLKTINNKRLSIDSIKLFRY